ncbi:MAG: radical SAM protein [Candidatus Aenigmarchaeota archaeon]|nr:radical SAM protein [Candidatus Aenigmarchaeota archaeon]
MKKIIETLVSWEKRGKGFPTQMQIHLTNFCNLKCIFCPTRALLSKDYIKVENELPTEKWLEIIDQGVELGVEEFHLCGGGEPFFFTDKCVAVMKHIKEYGKYGEVITNGMFLTEDVNETLVKIGWNKVYVSLDAPNAKIQNFLRGVDCFDKIIRNIKNLVKMKKHWKSDKPRIAFHMVVCNKNYKLIPQMLKLAERVGVDEVLLNALNIWKQEIEKLKLSKKQEKELEHILKELLKNDINVDTNLQEFLAFNFVESANVMNEKLESVVEQTKAKGLLKVPCFYPWYNISIFADGIAQPCFIPQNVGESVKEKSLKEIWFGKVFNDFRKNLLKGSLTGYCARCNPWNLPKMEEIRNELRKALKF